MALQLGCLGLVDVSWILASFLKDSFRHLELLVFYFKSCAFAFRFSLLFKADAPGFLLMGVIESFK